jgi:hypothetical protein
MSAPPPPSPPKAPPPGEHPLARELARIVRQAVGKTLSQAAQADADAVPPLTVTASPQATGPATLAMAHPAGKARRDAQTLYFECLAHYRAKVQRPLRPEGTEDDVGLAAAHFVLANLAAIDNTEPDAHCLPALERQLRHLISMTQSWPSVPLAQRQNLFEQLALLGVLINESRLQARLQGDAARANLQRGARAYLQQLLGLDADTLALTTQGLVTAETVH